MNDIPTSPVNDGANTPETAKEIEGVFGDGPSPAERAAPAPSMRAEWRRLGAFLKRPTLDVREQNGAPLLVLARIYTLDMMMMAALILAASIAVALGFYIPETALAGIEFTPLVIALVVIGAPVFEELVFRGWLSGKPQHIIALIGVLGGMAGFGMIHRSGVGAAIAVMVAGFIVAALALVFLRNRGPMRWFAAIFPAFFWLATVSFALVHLWNFDEGALYILLPLVLPQFVLGMMVGYLRVRIGLWAAIALHAAHNASALAIAALASLVGGQNV